MNRNDLLNLPPQAVTALSEQKVLYRFCSAIALAGIFTISSGFGLLTEANAADFSNSAIARTDQAQKPTSSKTQLPQPLANALRQDLSKRTGIPPGKLRVVEATRKTWPDGCLGLAKPGEMCTFAMVEGWRVVMSNGNRRWVYRTDSQGHTMRLEAGDRSSNITPTQIPVSELPPALSKTAIFRTIASGGITGSTYETTLWSDGRLVRVLINPTALVKPDVRQLSPKQVRQFQQMLLNSDLSRYHQLNYPAVNGSADYITVTLVSRSGVIRYADTIQNQLPQPLQNLIQAWNQLS